MECKAGMLPSMRRNDDGRDSNKRRNDASALLPGLTAAARYVLPWRGSRQTSNRPCRKYAMPGSRVGSAASVVAALADPKTRARRLVMAVLSVVAPSGRKILRVNQKVVKSV